MDTYKMIVSSKTMSGCVKYFKENRIISTGYIIRKYKLSFEMAQEVSNIIAKRYPNIWREGREKFMKDYLGHR
jgi:hypothetical protein